MPSSLLEYVFCFYTLFVRNCDPFVYAVACYTRLLLRVSHKLVGRHCITSVLSLPDVRG